MAREDKTMLTLDLMSNGHYPPLDSRTPEELFELAVKIASALDNVRVVAPVGDRPEDRVVLTSKLMHKKGAALF
jgi:hypothetical protein